MSPTGRWCRTGWSAGGQPSCRPSPPKDGEPICAETLQSYDETLALIYPRIKGITLDALDADHVDRLLADLAEAGYARTRIKRVYFTLKDAIDHAVARRKKSWNPVSHATFPVTVPPRKGRALTADELARFKATAPQDRLGALYLLGFATGTRPGEYAGSEWSRVDLSAGTIAVERALDHDDRELGDVKTVTRTIGLPSWALDMLRAHKKRQIEERLATGPVWQTSDLVFTTEIGTPLDMRRVNRRNFKRICSRPGSRATCARTTPATTRPARCSTPGCRSRRSPMCWATRR